MVIPVMGILEKQKYLARKKEFKEFFDIFIKWNLGLFLQLIFHKLDLKIINSEKLSFNKINSPGIYHQNCIGLKYFMIT